jgi:tryptophan synthase alpha chain
MSIHLEELFQCGRGKVPARFLPYVCVGYPTFDVSLAVARAALDAGADALELGVPFSDPIADGTTLQRATQTSLAGGTRPIDVFRLIRALRRGGYHQPLLVMSYINPIERMGWVAFAGALRNAGGDGAIVPDLPVEAMQEPFRLMKTHGLSLIPFLSPTSGKERMRRVDSFKAPFLYYVAVTGVTGARRSVGSDLLPRLRSLKREVSTPVVVGFGISDAAQARRVGREARGIIIASALINRIGRTALSRVPNVVGKFCRGIVVALRKG